MKYIYLMWDHDEYGPENLVATLDKEKVLELAGTFDYLTDKDIHRLKAILKKDDEENTYRLGTGWGGAHFQVARLF